MSSCESEGQSVRKWHSGYPDFSATVLSFGIMHSGLWICGKPEGLYGAICGGYARLVPPNKSMQTDQINLSHLLHAQETRQLALAAGSFSS